MAKRLEHRKYNVAVVGFSGSEKEKGVEGIGKSCFCNRFIRPLADDYKVDHISVLSQSDFSGPVINNDHFLYWGHTVQQAEDGTDLTFHVIEQTEFIDDTSFQPFKSGKTEAYIKRCTAVKLQSAEKLMYICKNQLGLEHEFEQVYMPDGKLTIDGFLCLFDVSKVQQRPFERQLEYTSHILSHLVKTKKPVLLVTTKNDRAHDAFVREAEKLLSKLKGNLILVESSAHDNVNIESAFLALAHLIDKAKGRPKVASYQEAWKTRREIQDGIMETFKYLIRSIVTDYRTLWSPTLVQLEQQADYEEFRKMFGVDHARKVFRQHITNLRDNLIKKRKEYYLEKFKDVLKVILPDLPTIDDRTYNSILRWAPRQDWFDDYFVELDEDESWTEQEFLDSNEQRIPLDLLQRSESAQKVFSNYLTSLKEENKRTMLCQEFKRLLEENHNVGPGKSLKEVAIFFLGHECFSSLSDDDIAATYEKHQLEICDLAKREFQELLFENAHLFLGYDRCDITKNDLKKIVDHLQRSPQYRALARLEEDREILLLNHLGFLQCPSKEKCYFKRACMEILIEEILSDKAHRPQSWSQKNQFLLNPGENQINLVILGSKNLAEKLAYEIRLLCMEDEYLLDGKMYSMDYRTIDGDVSLPQNSLKTTDFIPHGCFCVFNSLETLNYICESLEKTLMVHPDRVEQVPFHGLPVVIILAYNPSISDAGLNELRQEGQSLADRLQCPFIDIPSSLMTDTSPRRFQEDQIGLAMHHLITSIQHRSSLVDRWHLADSIEPDIRILICFMCGDPYDLEIPLSPLLNHQCCYVTSDKYPTITLETYLDDNKRKVEVTMVSYHDGATLVVDELFHGYILLYSAKRRASLATLSTFVSNLDVAPIKIMAVTDTGGADAFFSNEHAKKLLMDGNALADKLGASFMATSSNFHLQTASYTPFFKEAWDRKADTESAFSFSGDESDEMESPVVSLPSNDKMRQRPPAQLPKPPPRYDSFLSQPKGSTISYGQTFDSSPIYDEVHTGRCHSDSEEGISRASSTSPLTEEDSASMGADEILYTEMMQCDTDHLIKPSQVKTRGKGFYTGWSSVNTKFDKLSLKKLTKSTTLPSSAAIKHHPADDIGDGDDGLYDSTVPLLSQMDGLAIEKGKVKMPPPTLPKPKPTAKPKPLDSQKFAGVRQTLSRNITQTNSFSAHIPRGKTMEKIEITGDYAEVKMLRKDALTHSHENNYASVADALPAGQLHRIRSTFRKEHGDIKGYTDSESDVTLERPVRPHKRKGRLKPSKKRFPNNLTQFTDEKYCLIGQQDFLQKVNISDGKDSTEDVASANTQKSTKKSRSFRRKKKPVQRSPDTETAVLTANSPVFGASELPPVSYVEDENGIPLVIAKCIKIIEEHGLNEEGIYRVPGVEKGESKLRRQLNKTDNIDFNVLDIGINSVASSLKKFFKELPNPVFSQSVLQRAINASQDSNHLQGMIQLRDVLNQLPPFNLRIMAYLARHLNKVDSHSEVNKMTADNLSMVFWTNLINAEELDPLEIPSYKLLMDRVLIPLIRYPDFFFGNGPAPEDWIPNGN